MDFLLPQREILWNVPSAVLTAFYISFAFVFLWVGFWFWKRSRRWNVGSSAPSGPSLGKLAKYLLTHERIRRDRYAGWMHLLIFWGFVILFIATILVAIQHYFHIIFLTGATYLVFSLVSDLGGLAFCVGIAMALWRRRRDGLSRLQRLTSTKAMLWLLLVVAVSGFLVEAARISKDFPWFETWSPVGYFLAKVLALGVSGEKTLSLHVFLWVTHAVAVGALFVVVPVTLLRHVMVAGLSVANPGQKLGVLNEPSAPVLQGVTLESFRKRDLIQADACLTCGLCTEVCPAEAAGKPLSPRAVVLGLREDVITVPEDAIWSCTTCNACDAACPVHINIVDKILTFRRAMVAQAKLSDTVSEALESTAERFNPFSRPNSQRMEWATGLSVSVAKEDEKVELLYWVGCAGAFDPGGRSVSQAMVRILNQMKIPYRVLGREERCTGDPVRRLGEETLWKELSQYNQDQFVKHGVKTILTHCPHCFHSFKNEYSKPMPNVVHHSQWLKEKLNDGTLKLRSKASEKLTFHDPCYLARANEEAEAPRAVLRSASQDQVEMSPSRQNTFCCGGGGGQMWLDVRGKTRVETIRASHVEASGAKTVATGCPFCRVMLEAGRSSLPAGQGGWRVRDLAELVVENLGEG